MFDSVALRSAALGYGAIFLSVLPVAEGAITIQAAGQAVGAYFYDMPAPAPFNPAWARGSNVVLHRGRP